MTWKKIEVRKERMVWLTLGILVHMLAFIMVPIIVFPDECTLIDVWR